MANLRVKCTHCGHVDNTVPGGLCPECHQPYDIPGDAVIYLYRKGSPMGIAGGFGIYINGEPFGHIGNRETLCIPVKYGAHNLHVAMGVALRCNDLLITLTPQNRFAYVKVWMKPGFWTNSFVLEPSTPEEMPNK